MSILSLNDSLSTTDTTFETVTVDINSIPLSLYIHIPWCVKKCPYCDFNSHELAGDHSLTKYEEYVDALILDAMSQQPLAQGRKISSIFIGGGTPSLLPITQYQRLFAQLRQYFDFACDIEITMEANPGTLEHAPFAEYLAVGINRLSIGVQSFAADKLVALGRIHDPDQALSAIRAARSAGFERVNVDLMHGLPKQSLQEALYDIQRAHDAGATHISWYQLTIEPNTVFYRSQPLLPDEDNLADIEAAGQSLLQQLGYENYEVSAWVGASDQACRHNLNYWQFGDYLAIGAGAHGKVSIDKDVVKIEPSIFTTLASIDSMDSRFVFDDGVYRFSKSRLPKDYMAKIDNVDRVYSGSDTSNYNSNDQQSDSDALLLHPPKMIDWHVIPKDEMVSEFMLNVLRLNKGVPWSLFEARTGLSLGEIDTQITSLINQGLLEKSSKILQPTDLGRRYLNQILKAFL